MIRHLLSRLVDRIEGRCAVITSEWGRCSIPDARTYRVNGTGTEDLVLPLCPTHAAMFRGVPL